MEYAERQLRFAMTRCLPQRVPQRGVLTLQYGFVRAHLRVLVFQQFA